jgi:hypothetical protein
MLKENSYLGLFQVVIPCEKLIGIVVIKMTLNLSAQQGIRQINTYRIQSV